MPATGCAGITILRANIKNMLLEVDSDLDMVPDYIEKGLAGCDPNKKASCPGRPAHLARAATEVYPRLRDRETPPVSG